MNVYTSCWQTRYRIIVRIQWTSNDEVVKYQPPVVFDFIVENANSVQCLLWKVGLYRCKYHSVTICNARNPSSVTLKKWIIEKESRIKETRAEWPHKTTLFDFLRTLPLWYEAVNVRQMGILICAHARETTWLSWYWTKNRTTHNSILTRKQIESTLVATTEIIIWKTSVSKSPSTQYFRNCLIANREVVRCATALSFEPARWRKNSFYILIRVSDIFFAFFCGRRIACIYKMYTCCININLPIQLWLVQRAIVPRSSHHCTDNQ